MRKAFALNGREFSFDFGENVSVEMSFLQSKDG